MKLTAIITVILFSLIENVSLAQKIKLISGMPELLKSESYVGFTYTYEDLKIFNDPEAEYLRKKQMNSAQLKEYEEKKQSLYPGQFLTGFNKGAFKGGLYMTNQMKSPYSARMDVKLIEPGAHAATNSQSSNVEMDIEIYESDNPENVIALFRIEKCFDGLPNMEVSDETFYIGKAFYKAGFEFGEYLSKKYLK